MNNQRAIDLLAVAIKNNINAQYVYCDDNKLGVSDNQPTRGSYVYINRQTADIKSVIGQFLNLNYTNQY